MDQIDHSKTIDNLGGTGVVASLCDVSSQAVSKWRRNGIPRAWLKYFREAYPQAFVVVADESREAA